MTYYGDEAFPALSDEQWARLQSYGSAHEVESGALLWGAGEATYDLILVDSGEAEVVRAATARAAEAVVARFGTGQFVGELGLLTGQATYLSARVSKPGQVHRISPVSFRQLMDEDPDLSDVILRALMARRRNLRGGEAARSIEILGSEMSAGALALRTYAARQQLPHTWVEIDTPAGAALARAVAAAGADLPVVITPTAVLRHATPALLAGHLGLSYQPAAGPLLDLVIVGAGPAGLAAAVYGASEGLRTLLLDAVAAGGQDDVAGHGAERSRRDAHGHAVGAALLARLGGVDLRRRRGPQGVLVDGGEAGAGQMVAIARGQLGVHRRVVAALPRRREALDVLLAGRLVAGADDETDHEGQAAHREHGDEALLRARGRATRRRAARRVFPARWRRRSFAPSGPPG